MILYNIYISNKPTYPDTFGLKS